MPLPEVWARVLVKFATNHKSQMWNTLYYSPSAAPGPPAEGFTHASQLASNIQGSVLPAYAACMTAESSIVGIIVELHNATGVYTRGVFSGLAGTIVGDTCPSYTAVVIQRRTALPGRRFRGRIYVPAVPESKTDDSYLLDAGVWNTLAEALMGQQDAEGAGWAPFHYAPSVTDLVPVTAFVVNGVLGTMRTRKVKTAI